MQIFFFLFWYIVFTLLGLLTFPIAYRILGKLPDRGYALSRTFGWLLWGFVFWLLGSFGILTNDIGGLFISLLLLLAVSGWSLKIIGWESIRDWMRTNRRLIISVELLFLGAFGIWSIVRAANPEIAWTEKPMELAFLNALLRSETIPPYDPWLSGFAISYYYFGYVLVTMIAKLTGTPAGIAFNLGISSIFALTALGAYSVIFNLLNSRKGPDQENSGNKGGLTTQLLSLFGPLFILVVSNLEGFLDALHAKGFFWKPDGAGGWTSRFWEWLNIEHLEFPPIGLTNPEMAALSWEPKRNWWWWVASRVLRDFDLAGNELEVIDEFPFFSFLLADLHPHVLALPFALLAISLGLNLILGGWRGMTRLWRLELHISPIGFLTAGIVFGGMAFLNTWDILAYVALFAIAYAFYRAKNFGWSWRRLGDILGMGFAVGVLSFLLYLPFFLSFSSQAGGIVPNLVFITTGAHLWVMWGSLWIPIIAYLIFLWKQKSDSTGLAPALIISIGLGLTLYLVSLVLSWVALGLPEIGDFYASLIGAPDDYAPFSAVLLRLRYFGGWLTLLCFIATVLTLIWPKSNGENKEDAGQATRSGLVPAHLFTLVMIFVATMLVFLPEFIYLRDFFGYRINTIFKFYFQAWMLYGLSAAFGVAILLKELQGRWRIVYQVGLIIVLIMALTYPIISLQTKTNDFQPTKWTLDGTDHGYYLSEEEHAAVEWLLDAPLGVLVEAVGGSFSPYGHGRMSSHSGQPTILGWEGHENQWRGGYEEIGSRKSDVQRLYTTTRWSDVQSILEAYNVRYIVVGDLERNTYRVYEQKFIQNMTIVFQQGAVAIYEVQR